MATKFFIFILFITCSCHSSKIYLNKSIIWTDSLSVSEAINKLSLCEEIQLVSDSLDVFIDNKNIFAETLLLSVSKQTKHMILIPTSTLNIGFSNEQRRKQLGEQIDAIRNSFCPKSP